MPTYPQTIQIFHSPKAEFNCVFNALLVHLERYPTEYDLKLLSQLPDKNNSNKFTLFYNKRRLGTIRLKYKNGLNEPFRVSYTPLAISN